MIPNVNTFPLVKYMLCQTGKFFSFTRIKILVWDPIPMHGINKAFCPHN